jgi:hypothetical protein
VQTSLSRGLDAAARSGYLSSADDVLDPFADAVEVVLPSTVTLAGRTSEIPITVRNSLPYPVNVRLRLSSPKLVFPDGDPILTVEDTVQVRLPVEARSNGTFQLVMTAVTPEGDVAVSPRAQATVRVTAVAGLGLALSVGAVLVLITWWVHHARSVRRKRRLAGSGESAARHPANGVAPSGAPSTASPGSAPPDTAEQPLVAAEPASTEEQPVVGAAPPAAARSPDTASAPDLTSEDTAEHPVVGP